MDITPEAYYDLQRRYLALQERVSVLQQRDDTRTASDAIQAALSGYDPATTDTANIETVLRGRNLRVEAGVAIVDLPGDDGELTLSVSEAVPYMAGRTAEYGNLFYAQKPREPSAQERHHAKLAAMTDKQFQAYRKQRGPDYLEPEPEQP